MNILVSNDDGVLAPGILLLAAEVRTTIDEVMKILDGRAVAGQPE